MYDIKSRIICYFQWGSNFDNLNEFGRISSNKSIEDHSIRNFRRMPIQPTNHILFDVVVSQKTAMGYLQVSPSPNTERWFWQWEGTNYLREIRQVPNQKTTKEGTVQLLDKGSDLGLGRAEWPVFQDLPDQTAGCLLQLRGPEDTSLLLYKRQTLGTLGILRTKKIAAQDQLPKICPQVLPSRQDHSSLSQWPDSVHQWFSKQSIS